MNSGLYDRAGDSATESDAACAKRFDAPMMKFSKVYFGLSEPFCRGSVGSAVRCVADAASVSWARAPDAGRFTRSLSLGSVATTNSQRTGLPLSVCAASSRIPT